MLQDVSLLPYNTFHIDAKAEYFTELHRIQDLQELSEWRGGSFPGHVLGGGSNVLLTADVKGLVVKNCLKGIEVVDENEDHVWLSVGAGEIWHELVMYTIEQGWGGLENLSLIPGCVGAAPIQNIGAYGVEAKETIEEVSGWLWEERGFVALGNKECRFGYRDSVFKQELKDKVVITSVLFRLSKHPRFHISYGAIRQQLELMGVGTPSVKSISEAVISIRTSKLPDPAVIGNAGSFFKNPAVSIEFYNKLLEHYPALPSYPVNEASVKIPAGWLIEHCGWKGYRDGDAGVHKKQALVLVNYGHANGEEIWALSGKIVGSVEDKFGITLEREVQVW